MQGIFHLLAYLLTEHDCVIIPGFGGFVVQSEPAHCSASDGIFMPPYRTVGFNADLYHNDGLLINSLMRLEDTDYKTAQIRAEQFSEHLKSVLDTDGKVVFLEIGSLTVTSEGNYHFNPARETSANIAMYGFSSFFLPSLSQLETEVPVQQILPEKDRNVILIPIRKSFIKTVSAAAAIVVAVLMISSPIDNNSIPSQYAGVIDHTSASQLQQPVPPAKIRSKGLRKMESFVIKPEMQQKTMDQPVREETTQQPIVEKASNITQIPERSYYIIVNSSTNKEYAEKQLPQVRAELTPKANIIDKQNLFRIYVAEFSNKKEAETFLYDFRTKHPKYETAWLLSVKN